MTKSGEMFLDQLAAEIRKDLPEAAQLSDYRLKSLIAEIISQQALEEAYAAALAALTQDVIKLAKLQLSYI